MKDYVHLVTLEGMETQYCQKCETIVVHSITGKYFCNCSFVSDKVFEDKLYHLLPEEWVMVQIIVSEVVHR